MFSTVRPLTLTLTAAIFLFPVDERRVDDICRHSLRHRRDDHVTTSRGVMLVDGAICEPIQLPMCRSMPYNVTRLPNLLFHSTQLNAGLVLEQFQPLVDTGCSDVIDNSSRTAGAVTSLGAARVQRQQPSTLVFFLCSMFVPVCPRGFAAGLRRRRRPLAQATDDGDLIPPCRELCERAKAGCDSVLARHGIVWPAELDCAALPSHDTGICIAPDSIDSAVAFNITAECRCSNATDTMSIRKAYMSSKFNYAIRATYLNTSGPPGSPSGGMVRVRLRQVLRSRAMPPSAVYQRGSAGRRELELWTPARCGGCRPAVRRQQLVHGSDYLIVGHVDRVLQRMMFDDVTVVRPWNNKWPNLIKKWDSRLKNSQRQHRKTKQRTSNT